MVAVAKAIMQLHPIRKSYKIRAGERDSTQQHVDGSELFGYYSRRKSVDYRWLNSSLFYLFSVMSIAVTVADANKDMWASTTRSLRIDGVVTSIRLEKIFWETLELIAARDAVQVPQMISLLYNESIKVGYNMHNFTSFLRVCCAYHLKLNGD